MPTPEWRHEKARAVVESQCRLLGLDLNSDQRTEVTSSIHNALKLLCDSIVAGEPERSDCWSNQLVELFIQQPEKCSKWLSLLDSDGFKPESFLT